MDTAENSAQGGRRCGRTASGNTKSRGISEVMYIKILLVGMITVLLIQAVLVIIMIYLGIRIARLSTDVDDIANRM